MTLQEAQQLMEGAMKHLREEFSKMQVGRASTSMVEDMLVDAYGSSQPMKTVANLSTPESNQILIQPWDKGMLANIEKAIRDRSDLGLNPVNDGASVRLTLPQPTEERRKDLVKVAHAKGEEAKISVRNARHKYHTFVKEQLKAKEISEDESRGMENKLQEVVDKINKDIDDHVKTKEKEIMTV